MQVVCPTLYDVVIDYVLLDAFDDLSSPPQSVVAVIQNRWLTSGFKETVGDAPCFVHLASRRACRLLPAVTKRNPNVMRGAPNSSAPIAKP